MTSPSVHLGPSSWDRDMQGLDIDAESDNLAALGMHVTGAKAGDDEEEEEKEELEEKSVEKVLGEEPVVEEEEEKKAPEDEPEELDELKELDRLERALKDEDDPVAMADDED
ncbi:MAG: hypothetical protein WCK01_03185 [Candidatus Uhrbacteria bacterium]